MKTTIKPATPGAIVRHADTMKPLAAEGEAVEINSYWQRRLNDGSVVIASAPSGKKAKE